MQAKNQNIIVKFIFKHTENRMQENTIHSKIPQMTILPGAISWHKPEDRIFNNSCSLLSTLVSFHILVPYKIDKIIYNVHSMN